MASENTTQESREEIRKRRQAEQRRKQRIRSALIILFILFSLINIGFGILNLKTLIDKKREGNAQESQEAVPEETPGEDSRESGAPDTTDSTPEETEPPETDTKPTETEPPETETEPRETEPSETPSESGSQSGLENDPRYEVTKKYENIGVIHNVNNFLNIRKEPDSSSVTIGKAMRRSAVTVLETEDNGWLKIRSGEHEGYVSGDYVATGEEGKVLAMEYCKNNAFSTERDTPVYRSASKDEEVIFSINPENGYSVLDVLGTWVKIQITEGLSGYVERDAVNVRYTLEEPIFFVNDQDVSELRLDIVNKAFEYYGGKYVWGGADLATGVDCSGFTLRIYESFGISLPRLSYEQAKWGRAVSSMSEAQPGDLLFFHGYRNGTVTPGIGHVAIYIGNGKMIHAASEARGIVADNYNYLGEPVSIRRVVTEQAEASYKGNH